jgi:hypothetical protein
MWESSAGLQLLIYLQTSKSSFLSWSSALRTLLNTHVYRAVRRCICLRDANDLLLDLPSSRSFVTNVFVTFRWQFIIGQREA